MTKDKSRNKKQIEDFTYWGNNSDFDEKCYRVSLELAKIITKIESLKKQLFNFWRLSGYAKEISYENFLTRRDLCGDLHFLYEQADKKVSLLKIKKVAEKYY